MNDSQFTSLAEQFGTPLYVYDGEGIRSGAHALLEALRGQVEVYYSIKANPAIAVCSLIRQSGVHGAEIASSGELVAAQASGFTADQILFAGPGKTDEELHQSVSAGVGQINAESIHEIRRIQSIAQQLNMTQRVGVRVNPSMGSSNSARIRTSGAGQKFGMSESQAMAAINELNESLHMEFAGLHTMLGSQVLNAKILLDTCDSTIAMATRISSELNISIPSINFGGGLGVPHTEDDDEFDLVTFGDELVKLINNAKAHRLLRDCRFMIEPGRVLVSEHGVYLTRVVDTKDSDGSNIVILDGGINHALLPITANRYRVEVVSPRSTSITKQVTVGGPLCTSADQWRSQVSLKDVQVGDLVTMHNAGAYGLTASMTKFLSRETPAEILIIQDGAYLIRERSQPNDVLLGQSIPRILQQGSIRKCK